MSRLKVIVIAAGVSIVVAACSTGGGGGGGAVSGGGQMTGAASSQLAVEQFLAAARAQDLQAFSAIWGSERGPAREGRSQRALDGVLGLGVEV